MVIFAASSLPASVLRLPEPVDSARASRNSQKCFCFNFTGSIFAQTVGLLFLARSHRLQAALRNDAFREMLRFFPTSLRFFGLLRCKNIFKMRIFRFSACPKLTANLPRSNCFRHCTIHTMSYGTLNLL